MKQDIMGEQLEWAALMQNIISIPEAIVANERTIISGYLTLLEKGSVELAYSQEVRTALTRRLCEKEKVWAFLGA